LAALHYRARSGQGQLIDIALFDVQLSWLANVASAHLVSGLPPGRHGNAHATIVPYQPFAAADGYVMIAVGNDGQFARLCAALGHPEWPSDPRFATNPARVATRAELVPLIAEIIVGRSVADWVDALLAADVPCAPVNDIPAALADPQAQTRSMVQEIRSADGPPLRLVGPAPKLSATPATIRSAPPRHGQHTDAVLGELLGYGPEMIARLRADGTI
jgi:crotonobetainyl-CoA:carnitine CoA-transferase CaiB-like acyl-CoA transferase